MKTLFAIFAILTTVVLSAQTTINFTATTSGTITANTWDVVSNSNGDIYVSSNTNGVLKSTDGGITFNTTSMSSSVGDMVCLGNNIISYHWKSNDGGITWSSHTMLGVGSSVMKFIKLSETTALAVNGSGSFVKTIDGGLSWGSTTYYLPSTSAGSLAGYSIFKLNNGDVIVPYKGSVNDTYMISKDNLVSYSYSITTPHSETEIYNSGYVDASGNYLFFKSNGNIDVYPQNQNSSIPTFTNSYSVNGSSTNTSKFGRGTVLSNNFYVIDKNANTNCILKTEAIITSVSELNNDLLISIYPNPVSSELVVKTKHNQSVSIINYSGSEVLSAQTNDPINVSELSSGIYFVKAGNSMKKFIKE